jgi:hypothetical protein
VTGRTIVDVLCEAVQTGTLFVDTSKEGFLPSPGFIYAPTTMRDKASKEFVTLWSYTLGAAAKVRVTRHTPSKVVDELIRSHGLVVIIKRLAADISHVAEAAGDLGKALRGAINRPSSGGLGLLPDLSKAKKLHRFIYASSVVKPTFSPAQVAKIREIFDPEPDDTFYRIECLSDCKKVVDETTAEALFKKGEAK